ncbi:MAG TPA: hypothetical protein VGX92_17435 [Pyrinomonadaceae bacterium]|nr:hypothetical protein [Pyrinomonadaceae bacterium]
MHKAAARHAAAGHAYLSIVLMFNARALARTSSYRLNVGGEQTANDRSLRRRRIPAEGLHYAIGCAPPLAEFQQQQLR